MSQGRLVFLTGATGFIGSRLAARLAARGDRLRCLVRGRSETAALERLGSELVEGELTDPATLTRALEGVDLAYHLAAIYDVGVVDAASLERVNVGGTAAFLEAVERAGTPRAVYVSTTAALAPAPAGEGDETSEVEPGASFPSVYHRTKTEAHRRARAAQAAGLPLVMVCPAFVYGPGDRGPGGRFTADLLAGRVPGLLSRAGWFSYVHVDDVVEGLLLAGDQGRPGEVYVLSGEHCSVDDFAARVCALAGKRPPLLRFPIPLARLSGSALDLVSRLTGFRFPISRENVDVTAGLRWLHSHAKATRELGWHPRSLDEGLPETVAWFRGGAVAPAE
jgi:nucleoside-diphosphate-sugar epimerase